MRRVFIIFLFYFVCVESSWSRICPKIATKEELEMAGYQKVGLDRGVKAFAKIKGFSLSSEQPMDKTFTFADPSKLGLYYEFGKSISGPEEEFTEKWCFYKGVSPLDGTIEPHFYRAKKKASEVTRFIKKVGHKMEDFGSAVWKKTKNVGSAVWGKVKGVFQKKPKEEVNGLKAAVFLPGEPLVSREKKDVMKPQLLESPMQGPLVAEAHISDIAQDTFYGDTDSLPIATVHPPVLLESHLVQEPDQARIPMRELDMSLG